MGARLRPIDHLKGNLKMSEKYNRGHLLQCMRGGKTKGRAYGLALRSKGLGVKGTLERAYKTLYERRSGLQTTGPDSLARKQKDLDGLSDANVDLELALEDILGPHDYVLDRLRAECQGNPTLKRNLDRPPEGLKHALELRLLDALEADDQPTLQEMRAWAVEYINAELLK